MKVLFFAQSRLAAGCEESLLPAERPLTTAEFWDRLVAAHPPLAPLRKTARLARHATYLAPDDLLHPEDEVAIIPAVSGG
jgi:molybdopterin converting factor small subunit